MARFRGTLQGSRGEASRLGHTSSGLHMRASGWNGHIRIHLFDINGIDYAQVVHEDRNGNCTRLYHGPLNNYRDPRGSRLPMKQPLELAALTTQQEDDNE